MELLGINLILEAFIPCNFIHNVVARITSCLNTFCPNIIALLFSFLPKFNSYLFLKVKLAIYFCVPCDFITKSWNMNILFTKKLMSVEIKLCIQKTVCENTTTNYNLLLTIFTFNIHFSQEPRRS